jgi:Family of unknown function (DUF6941)
MRAVISFVAQGVVRDADTNNISAFNLMESITVEGLPVLVPNLSFFVLWERELNEDAVHQATLNVRLDQRVLLTTGARVDFQGFARARSINNIAGLVLPMVGQLVFEMLIENGPSATYTVTINAAAAAQAPPPRVEER